MGNTESYSYLKKKLMRKIVISIFLVLVWTQSVFATDIDNHCGENGYPYSVFQHETYGTFEFCADWTPSQSPGGSCYCGYEESGWKGSCGGASDDGWQESDAGGTFDGYNIIKKFTSVNVCEGSCYGSAAGGYNAMYYAVCLKIEDECPDGYTKNSETGECECNDDLDHDGICGDIGPCQGTVTGTEAYCEGFVASCSADSCTPVDFCPQGYVMSEEGRCEPLPPESTTTTPEEEECDMEWHQTDYQMSWDNPDDPMTEAMALEFEFQDFNVPPNCRNWVQFITIYIHCDEKWKCEALASGNSGSITGCTVEEKIRATYGAKHSGEATYHEKGFKLGNLCPDVSIHPDIPRDNTTTIPDDDTTTTIPGGSATTTTPGGNGTTTIPGGNGTTTIPGGNGTTTIPGGSATTTTPGGNGTTTIPGGNGTTTIPGGNGTTTIPGGNGTTTIPGGGDTTTTIPGGGDNNLPTYQTPSMPSLGSTGTDDNPNEVPEYEQNENGMPADMPTGKFQEVYIEKKSLVKDLLNDKFQVKAVPGQCSFWFTTRVMGRPVTAKFSMCEYYDVLIRIAMLWVAACQIHCIFIMIGRRD